MIFQNLDDVITVQKENGFHFFDSWQMQAWDSRIESELVAGRYFITSETPTLIKGVHERRYTIREVLPSGFVRSLGTFMKYKTKAQARATISKLYSRAKKYQKKAS